MLHSRKFLKIGTAILASFAAFGFTWEQIARSLDAQHPFRIGRPIDVGDGRTLNIHCQGSGAPAVILEAGGGQGGYGWQTVQTQIASTTAVCWYDRAGEGWSDPPPAARTSSLVISDLHELLHRAGVPAPYILVGHSIGGEYVRIFAARFPSEVAGIVLVDATHPDQQEPPPLQSPINRAPVLAREISCLGLPLLNNFGLLRFFLRNTPVSVPVEFRSQEAAATPAFRRQRVKEIETDAVQGCAATRRGAIRPDHGSGNPEVDGAARSAGTLGHLPLVVLTAGKYWKPDDQAIAQQLDTYHATWVNQLQASLAHLSTNGKQIVVQQSDHAIPANSPQSVSTAVIEMVKDLRRHTTP